MHLEEKNVGADKVKAMIGLQKFPRSGPATPAISFASAQRGLWSDCRRRLLPGAQVDDSGFMYSKCSEAKNQRVESREILLYDY
jgi:hypothetical protein